jgi:hypothetical protein
LIEHGLGFDWHPHRFEMNFGFSVFGYLDSGPWRYFEVFAFRDGLLIQPLLGMVY